MKSLKMCRASGNPKKSSAGIGMPESLYLHEFGYLVSAAFDGEIAYHVGSSLLGPVWRDVDVRVMLEPEKYVGMGFGDPKHPHSNPKWCAFTMAFSELGRKMTGLPIDFQVQDRDEANSEYPTGRSALVFGHIRRQEAK